MAVENSNGNNILIRPFMGPQWRHRKMVLPTGNLINAFAVIDPIRIVK
jgi:hypothetical protein